MCLKIFKQEQMQNTFSPTYVMWAGGKVFCALSKWPKWYTFCTGRTISYLNNVSVLWFAGLCLVRNFWIIFLFIQKRQKHKQLVESEISKWLPEEKILQLDTSLDALNILRRIGSQKQKNVFFRSRRPYVLAEKLKFTSQVNFYLQFY